MNNSTGLLKKSPKAFLFLIVLLMFSTSLLSPLQVFCQELAATRLEKMPVDLERDYALSALPPHLRKGATLYLLDPAKGYYLAQKGTNGFVCFVERTNWEWGQFRNDLTMPISFDAEGFSKIFPVDRDVAAMRASGKFTAKQVKDSVMARVKKGIYKAPSRPGVSYMLEPVMRGYPGMPGNNNLMTMSMPHYMFYAPYMDNADIGGGNDNGPFVNNPDNIVFGDKKGPYGYIILPAGEAEAAKIVKASSDLLKRLIAYKSYYKI
jgi:hypothetical protein